VSAQKLPKPPHNKIKAIRLKCMDCHGEIIKGVRYCPSVTCALWPWRFGSRNPRYSAFLDPDNIPNASKLLEDCGDDRAGSEKT
jgi:hypothetical protein